MRGKTLTSISGDPASMPASAASVNATNPYNFCVTESCKSRTNFCRSDNAMAICFRRSALIKLAIWSADERIFSISSALNSALGGRTKPKTPTSLRSVCIGTKSNPP